MHISEVFRALKRRWYASLLVLVVAVGAAIMLNKSMKSVPTGTATVQILVDSPVSSLVNLQSDPAGLEARAAVLAQAMSSNAVLADIAKTAGVAPGDVTAQGPYSAPAESLDVATPSEARSMQIISVKPHYRLTIVAQQNLPIVTVGVQGPSAVAAGRLADDVVAGTTTWLSSLTATDEIKQPRHVHLRQLGDAQAGTTNSSSGKMIAIVGAVAVLILGFLGIALTDRERRARRQEERARAERMLDDAFHADSSASPVATTSAAAPPAHDYLHNGYVQNGHAQNGYGDGGVTVGQPLGHPGGDPADPEDSAALDFGAPADAMDGLETVAAAHGYHAVSDGPAPIAPDTTPSVAPSPAPTDPSRQLARRGGLRGRFAALRDDTNA